MTLPGYHDTMDISSQTSRFIAAHRNQDVRDLALSAKRVDGLDLPFALDQIAGWQTACRKLPQWAETDGIVYPPHISMEQCSSQLAAQYKAGIARRVAGAGGAMVDLTGGFGIDCAFLATQFKTVTYIERQEELCELAMHNFPLLGLKHIRVQNGDGVEYLQQMPAVDCIFLDPARRNEHGGKTVAISDCEPNVATLEKLLLEKGKQVMIKLSPMLDLSLAIRDMQHVSEAHIVSVNNESFCYYSGPVMILRRFHLQCLSPSSASILQTRKYNVLFSPANQNKPPSVHTPTK